MFVHLHTHTEFSLLDGISKLKDIVSKVEELGQPAIAITDHGNLFASYKMYKLCQKSKVKYIHGCEFYITKDMSIKDKSNKYYHLVILSKSEEGRLNINKLLSKAYKDGFYYKPRIDFDLLKQHKDGLIVLSACMAGEIQRSLQNGDYKSAKDIAIKYKNEFGNDYYLEIQAHSEPEQQKLNQLIVKLGKELSIPWVATCDSHYINKEDKELHGVFVAIGQEREVGESYNDCYIQSEEDVRSVLKTHLSDQDIEIAINNTIEVASKCNTDLPLSAPQIPHVSVPAPFKSEDDYLQHLCVQGWKNRGINKHPKERQQQYKDRLIYEFNAIKQMGFSGYYLLVESYANSVKRRGIARGSGGGSLVAYLLNIVDIDPVEHGLYFERFIDVSALDLLKEGIITEKELKIPDFDLDFGKSDREKVIDFIINRYGQEKVASIGLFQYIWDKSAIKDVGRVLGIPFEITNEMTKVLGDDYSLEEALEMGLLDKYHKEYPKLFDYAKKLSGLPKSFGKHPCGRCVTINNLTEYTATVPNEGEIVFQADMGDVEDMGLVKIDALGLRTIDIIYDVLDMISKDYDYINPSSLNFTDEKVLDIFCKGYTDGIFQFESDGMKQTLQKMQPTGLDDLSVANALYRPGSKVYIENFVNRKFGREEFEFLHPDLESILKNTYGIIVFQEQLIEIGRLAGMRNPDQLRVATGKKKPEVMAKVEPELREGLYKRGWTKEQVDQLWSDMLMFAKYSFNKSHSSAYAMIAFTVAKLKAYHPNELICALFNSYKDKHNKMGTCYQESQRLGVKIQGVVFGKSKSLCEINDGKVFFGIGLIKHCNSIIAEELFTLSNNKYDSFLDLLIDIQQKTSINQKMLNILTTLNFFSTFGQNHKLLSFISYFNDFYGKKQVKKDKVDKLELDHSIFEKLSRPTEKTYMDFDSRGSLEYMWEQIPDKAIHTQDQMAAELEYLGYIQTTRPDIDYEYGFVLDVNTKYTPVVTLYHIQNGEEKKYKVSKKIYYNERKEPIFNQGDVIKVKSIVQKSKKKKVGDEWQETGEFEDWMESLSVIRQK